MQRFHSLQHICCLSGLPSLLPALGSPLPFPIRTLTQSPPARCASACLRCRCVVRASICGWWLRPHVAGSAGCQCRWSVRGRWTHRGSAESDAGLFLLRRHSAHQVFHSLKRPRVSLKTRFQSFRIGWTPTTSISSCRKSSSTTRPVGMCISPSLARPIFCFARLR